MSNKKLESWIAKNKPARKISKLEKYQEEINMLVAQNYTQKQICKYLFEVYNIETTRENLSMYLKRRKNKSDRSSKNEYSNSKKYAKSKTQKQKNEEYLKMLESIGSKIDVT